MLVSRHHDWGLEIAEGHHVVAGLGVGADVDNWKATAWRSRAVQVAVHCTHAGLVYTVTVGAMLISRSLTSGKVGIRSLSFYLLCGDSTTELRISDR